MSLFLILRQATRCDSDIRQASVKGIWCSPLPAALHATNLAFAFLRLPLNSRIATSRQNNKNGQTFGFAVRLGFHCRRCRKMFFYFIHFFFFAVFVNLHTCRTCRRASAIFGCSWHWRMNLHLCLYLGTAMINLGVQQTQNTAIKVPSLAAIRQLECASHFTRY